MVIGLQAGMVNILNYKSLKFCEVKTQGHYETEASNLDWGKGEKVSAMKGKPQEDKGLFVLFTLIFPDSRMNEQRQCLN